MSRYGMIIDTRTCIGCMDCVVACKTENQVPEGFNRDWITYDTSGSFPTTSPRRATGAWASVATITCGRPTVD